MVMKIVSLINRFLSSHKRVNYLLKCIKRFNDNSFVDKVLDRNSEYVHFEHWGDSFSNMIIYYIEIGTKGDGFFAEYHRMLDYLNYADSHALMPYVFINNDFTYIDEDDIENGRNYFELYFKTYEGLGFSSVLNAKNIIRSNRAHIEAIGGKCAKTAYAMSDDYIEQLAFIARKYIKFNDLVMEYVNKSLNEIGFSDGILGVHFRGSDYKKAYNGHPTYVTPQEYLDVVKEILLLRGYKRVFLATDDTEALNIFIEEFGEKLIYYKDVSRTDGETSVAFIGMNRKKHHYKLGLEVIRDMLTLSKCQALVAGLSQVSICAIITNKAWEGKYSLLHIMDNGINHNKREYLV